MRIWTEAAKNAQREAIKRWKPWAKSTGPRTAQGKQKASTNARKAGCVSIRSRRTLNAALTAQSRCRRAINSFLFWQNTEISEKRTIMMAYFHRVYKAMEQAFYRGMEEWARLENEDSEHDQQIMSCDMRMAA